MKKATLFLILQIFTISLFAQINTDRVLAIGRNALYFEDYVLSIQYFNQVIKSKPWLAEPYFYRAVAKINLDDFKGAEEDCTLCLQRNPFLTQAYYARGTPDWLVWILCVVFTLLWARIAAVFANKAEPKTLNRATGVVLVVLGVVIMGFNLLG